MRKILSSHSIVLGFVTLAAVTIHVLVNVVFLPRARDAMSLQFGILAFAEIAFFLFVYLLFISGIFLLLRRRLFFSACYLLAGAVTYASCFAAAALKDDRWTFPSRSHREIVGIYHEKSAYFDMDRSRPHLISLGQQCHPPNNCECWILIDVGHSSEIERDVGGWRGPTAPIFLADTTTVRLSIVNVEVLDSSAYSILGCEVDNRGWMPT
jgi:hypothetical protein